MGRHAWGVACGTPWRLSRRRAARSIHSLSMQNFRFDQCELMRRCRHRRLCGRCRRAQQQTAVRRAREAKARKGEDDARRKAQFKATPYRSVGRGESWREMEERAEVWRRRTARLQACILLSISHSTTA